MNTDKFPIKPYLDEIKYQIQSALNSLSQSGDDYLNHHHFLIHCTIILKIITPYVDKEKINKREKGWKSELWKEKRKTAMFEYFENNKNILDDPGVKRARDCFEHYDERLDDAVQRGVIIQDNFFLRGKSNAYLRIPPNLEKFKLRNFENGSITINGITINTAVIKKWISTLLEYINKNPINEGGVSTITNNTFF